MSVVFGPIPVGLDLGLQTVIGMGIPEGHGMWTYNSGEDKVELTWPKDAEAQLLPRIRKRVDALSRASGGFVADTAELDPSTYHPLGGAVIGKVCDRYGRVAGARGLYVTDGAKIPGSTGAANPSFTIAALAELGADNSVKHDVGVVF